MKKKPFSYDSVESAIQDLQQGKMVIVIDDEQRENEGDLVMAAEKVTPESINFMTKFGRGLICAPLSSERSEQLNLTPMVKQENTSRYYTAFTISVDAIAGNTTGIACEERSRTLQALANHETQAADLMRPGHIFPLVAHRGGLRAREGHTEATLELLKRSKLTPVGVICEILADDGTMAREKELFQLAKTHSLKIIRIADLVNSMDEYSSKEPQLKKVETIQLPTSYGEFQLHLYEAFDTQGNVTAKHMAITKGKLAGQNNILMRIHSQCATGDIFGSMRCDCGEQLHLALEQIEREGQGALLYLEQEGRGIGLSNKIRAYKLQENGYDTVSANHALGFNMDDRNYQMVKDILDDLGIQSVRLMTNNPLKIEALKKLGISLQSRVPIEIAPNQNNEKYLVTKRDLMGHSILSKSARRR